MNDAGKLTHAFVGTGPYCDYRNVREQGQFTMSSQCGYPADAHEADA